MANNSENTNNQIGKSHLQSAVLDYQRSKKLIKLGVTAISVIMVLLTVFLALGWGSMNASGGIANTVPEDNGAFTVMAGEKKGNKSIAMSETRGFANPQNSFKTTGIANAWNTELSAIPADIDSEIGGAKNGVDDEERPIYFAFTLFLKNTGSEDFEFTQLVTLTENNKDAVKAIRIMTFYDGNRVIYAAPDKNGNKETYACDETFTGDVNIISKNATLTVGQKVRYTIVIWFEGNDPECVNDILGGTVKLDLSFNIVE